MGTSGSGGALERGDRERAQLAVLDQLGRGRDRLERERRVAGDHRLDRGRAAGRGYDRIVVLI
jgi:hypothetical protein